MIPFFFISSGSIRVMFYRQLCLAIFVGVCAVGHLAAAPVIDAEAAKQIDRVVNEAIAERKAPSCCVIIGTGGTTLFAKAYGRFTYDLDSPAATLDSRYDLASCSKPTGTGTALAVLIQNDKIKLDDPVSKYLPSWNRDDKCNITVRNLATHTTGLPAYTSVDRAEKGKKSGESNADALIHCIASLPLQYETNKGYKYSCLNFLTLARVNEEAGGLSQEALLRENIWEPLGMKNTGYYFSDADKKLCVPTLVKRQGDVHDPLAYYYRDKYHCPGNAGLFSSANDLSLLCRMIINDGKFGSRQILRPDVVEMFFANQAKGVDDYAWGLGWGISDNKRYPAPVVRTSKTAAISHSGYTGTYIELDRYAGTYTIILTNRVYPNDNTNITSIRVGVRKVVLDTDPLYATKK